MDERETTPPEPPRSGRGRVLRTSYLVALGLTVLATLVLTVWLRAEADRGPEADLGVVVPLMFPYAVLDVLAVLGLGWLFAGYHRRRALSAVASFLLFAATAVAVLVVFFTACWVSAAGLR